VAHEVRQRERDAESTPSGGAVQLSKPPADVEMRVSERDDLLKLYRLMLLVRRFEERAKVEYTHAKIGGYCHLNLGEEATVAGGLAPLRATDYLYTGYREHGHAIARGVPPRAVMSELFGREDGTSHGRGGSMHMFDESRRSRSPPARRSRSATARRCWARARRTVARTSCSACSATARRTSAPFTRR
jgi:hypothetical protein